MKKVVLKKKIQDFKKQIISDSKQKKIKGGTGNNSTTQTENDFLVEEDITPYF